MANDDQAKGTIKKTVGKMKEKLGRKSGDPELQDEGTADRAEGSLQKAKGDLKDKI